MGSTRGGVGLIITGYAYVTPDGRNPYPGMLGIHDDALIPRYRELVDHVHDHGARIVLHALNALQQNGGDHAMATLCIGGGQGIAAVFEKL